MKSFPSVRLWLPILVISLALSAVDLLRNGPLGEVHWDAPIWIHQAQRLLQTEYLESFSRHAREVSNEVQTAEFSSEQSFPESYWWFSRIGHSSLLALIMAPFGFTVSALWAAAIVYAALLCAMVAALTDFSIRWFSKDSVPGLKDTITATSLVAAYVLSDIFGYLSGNPLSEIPGMLLIVFSLQLTYRAIRTNSPLSAILAGLCIAAIGTIRMELIWTAVSWILVLPFAWETTISRRQSLRMVAITLATAAGAWIAYSIQYWPMTDPRLYIKYTGLFSGTHHGVPCIALLFAGGGTVWPALLLLAMVRGRIRSLRVPLAWLGLSSLPFMYLAFGDSTCPARTMAPIAVPLIFAGYGVVRLAVKDLGTTPKKRSAAIVVATATAVLVLISNAETWQLIRQQPVAWRLQVVRAWLAVPDYERISVPTERVKTLAASISELPTGAIIARQNPGEPMQQWLNIALFLGLQYQSSADLALVTDPTNSRSCSDNLPDHYLDVRFCDDSALSHKFGTEISVWRLDKDLQLRKLVDTVATP